MKDEIIDLAKKLIALNTSTSNQSGLKKVIGIVSNKLNDFYVEEFEKNGYKSLLINNCKKKERNFNIILNGHLDVIPGKEYLPSITNNKLFGVGAMDMKGSIACLVEVFRNIAYKVNYPLALQLVTDEQIGGLFGTKYQIDKGVRSKFIIVGEATNLAIVNQAKGVYWIKLKIQGKSGHSAYPWLGKNAISKASDFIAQLKKEFPNPNTDMWQTTLNISMIKTENTNYNKIPDECEMFIDLRYIPEDKSITLPKINKLLNSDIVLNVEFSEPPLNTTPKSFYIKKLKGVIRQVRKGKAELQKANGTSDATYYSKIGCHAIEFGPEGKKGNLGKEFVIISSIKVYYEILTKFLLSLKSCKIN